MAAGVRPDRALSILTQSMDDQTDVRKAKEDHGLMTSIGS